jgi:hypothetical protein
MLGNFYWYGLSTNTFTQNSIETPLTVRERDTRVTRSTEKNVE